MRVVVGDRVIVVGQPNEFMVVRVDLARQSADLMTTSGIRRIEEGVSLSALRHAGDANANIVDSPANRPLEG